MRLRIREIAEQQGLDAAKLSRRADLAYSTVYAVWNDPTANTNTRTLARIAQALGVAVVDLIDEDSPKVGALAAATNY